MKLVKVVGSITSTIKDKTLEGFKILLVRAIDVDLEEKDDFYVAVDTIGLGVGETALIVTGSTAKRTEVTRHNNVDAAIIAKVDRIDLKDSVIES